MKTIRIDVTAIDKSAIYVAPSGKKYIDMVMFENRDGGEDKYGNLGFVTQDIGKERRLAGERGPILGNFKEIGACSAQSAPPKEPASSAVNEDDDIPF